MDCASGLERNASRLIAIAAMPRVGGRAGTAAAWGKESGEASQEGGGSMPKLKFINMRVLANQ